MSDVLSAPLDNSAIEALEGTLLGHPQMEIKYVHRFAPGIYIREAHVKAGMVGIGHEHKQETINILLKGRLRIVNSDHTVLELQAPLTFNSAAGVRKTAYFLEDTIFQNVLPNPTNETDILKLEDLFVIKSQTFLDYEKQQQQSINEGKL